jgi:hydrogenase/urease accessory protein HupE
MKRFVRVLIVWTLAAWTLAWSGAAGAHVITFSHVQLRLEPGRTEARLRLPITALLQQTPPPLPAGTTDQALRAAPLPRELQASLAVLAQARLQLRSDGRPLPLIVDDVAPAGDEVAIAAHAPRASGALDLQANLFPDDPLHKVFVDVYRGPDLVGQYVLDRHDPGFTLAAPERPVLEVIATFVREGVHHIFIGPDHILFVLALVLLGGRLWSQVKIITAFTVAHSVTLALATLGLVHPSSRVVESTIALSIVVVGLHDLRQLRRGAGAPAGPDPRAVLAFAFGLVHGFGFASALAEMDLPRAALAWSLAAFNIGVEIGQVTIVLLAAPLVMALRRWAPPRLARDVLSAAACVVVAVGGYWLVQRAFGL